MLFRSLGKLKRGVKDNVFVLYNTTVLVVVLVPDTVNKLKLSIAKIPVVEATKFPLGKET